MLLKIEGYYVSIVKEHNLEITTTEALPYGTNPVCMLTERRQTEADRARHEQGLWSTSACVRTYAAYPVT